MTTISSEMIVLVLFIWYSYREVPVKKYFSGSIQYAAAALVMAAAVCLVKNFTEGMLIFLSVPVGACVYFALLKLMKNELLEEGLRMMLSGRRDKC